MNGFPSCAPESGDKSSAHLLGWHRGVSGQSWERRLAEPAFSRQGVWFQEEEPFLPSSVPVPARRWRQAASKKGPHRPCHPTSGVHTGIHTLV